MSKKVFEGKPIPFMSPQTPLYKPWTDKIFIFQKRMNTATLINVQHVTYLLI